MSFLVAYFFVMTVSTSSEGVLDISNDIQLFALRFVFEARIYSRLECFVEGWNNHPLSAEKNMLPNQLLVFGLHRAPDDAIITQFAEALLLDGNGGNTQFPDSREELEKCRNEIWEKLNKCSDDKETAGVAFAVCTEVSIVK
eukprot:gene16408-18044_t